jgi:hypothetical protein
MRLSDCPHWLHKGCLQVSPHGFCNVSRALQLTSKQQWLRGATTCPVCRQRVLCPQPTRRERGARADPQPGSSRGADRSTLDIARGMREHVHVRMAFPDYTTVVSRSDAGPSGSGLEAEREIAPQDGDVADMSLDWDIAGPI